MFQMSEEERQAELQKYRKAASLSKEHCIEISVQLSSGIKLLESEIAAARINKAYDVVPYLGSRIKFLQDIAQRVANHIIVFEHEGEDG
jgi:hypothetical protein